MIFTLLEIRVPAHRNRRRAGTDPLRCPDCRAIAARVPNPLLPGRPPQVQHEPTCPALRAAEAQFADDLRWLLTHPDRRRRVRPVTAAECDEMATALGDVVPPADRPHWSVTVARRGSGLARGYWRGRTLVAVNVSVCDAAGAR